MQDFTFNTFEWRQRFKKSSYFFGALLLHVVVIFMIATWIIYRAQPDVNDTNFLAVPTKHQAPPPPPPPAAGGGAPLNPLNSVPPPPSAPSVISSTALSSFTIKSVKVAIPNLPMSDIHSNGLGILGHGGLGHGSGTGFGDANGNGTPQLVGTLYDLKQSPDHRPTDLAGNDPAFGERIREFIANWDEPTLASSYYKSRVVLNTSSIFIPTLDAEDGPRAFGVEKEVKPDRYVIIYHVSATAPEDGTYRFVGGADDLIIVRVNGKVVLDGSLDNMWTGRQNLKSYPLEPAVGSVDKLVVGEPFQATSNEPVKIDILIGEWPGGISSYFLLIQKEGHKYTKQANGNPLLPIFQLDSDSLIPKADPSTYPPFDPTPAPWTGVSSDSTAQ